jgi:hypothetical protein
MLLCNVGYDTTLNLDQQRWNTVCVRENLPTCMFSSLPTTSSGSATCAAILRLKHAGKPSAAAVCCLQALIEIRSDE